MNSKEALRVIKKDLDKLEKLEKENKVLRERVNHFKNVKNRHRRNQKFVEKENEKLKKVIKILKDYLMINVFINEEGEYALESNHFAIPRLNKEEYDLLKEWL